MSVEGKATAVGNVFIACATMLPREGLTYDEWLHEVTRRFKRAWKVVSG